MAGKCSVGILIDLSSPAADDVERGQENENEDPNNTFTLTDCIEIVRSDDSDRRLSHTLVTPMDREDRILKDVTEKVVSNSQIENSPEMLIQDEIYDFDLVLSANESTTMDEQEEEVFFGPIGFTEQSLSPLNPQQFANITKEAHRIADLFSNMKVSSSCEKMKSLPSKILGSNRKTPVKSHQRKGTFELKIPIQNLFPDASKTKIPHVEDQENVPPSAPLKAQKCFPSTNITNVPINNEKSSLNICDAKCVDKSSLVCLKVAVGTSGHSRLKKPTKLAHVKKPRSYTLLPKVKSCENIGQQSINEVPASDVIGDSDTDSVASDFSDVRESKLPFVKSGLPVMSKSSENLNKPAKRKRQHSGDSDANSETYNVATDCSYINKSSLLKMSKSVEHIEHSASNKMRHLSGRSEANSDTSSIASDISDTSASRLPVVCKMLKSSLPSRKWGMPAVIGKNQIPAVKSGIPAVNNKVQAPKNRMPATKAPMGKLQLVRPGQIQKSKLAFPRAKPSSAASGPVRAMAAAKTSEPRSKPGSAPVKPEKCANTKPEQTVTSSTKQLQNTVTKSALQTHTNRLSMNVGTPAKSTSSSTGSFGSDTPSRRRSHLPTPTKWGLSSSSSISPSPLRNSSRVSSNASTGSRRMLLSDEGGSPVFALNGNLGHKIATPRKPPVQNTPEIPKRTRSVWSPVRRNPTTEDQPFLCTKRTNRKN